RSKSRSSSDMTVKSMSGALNFCVCAGPTAGVAAADAPGPVCDFAARFCPEAPAPVTAGLICEPPGDDALDAGPGRTILAPSDGTRATLEAPAPGAATIPDRPGITPDDALASACTPGMAPDAPGFPGTPGRATFNAVRCKRGRLPPPEPAAGGASKTISAD